MKKFALVFISFTTLSAFAGCPDWVEFDTLNCHSQDNQYSVGLSENGGFTVDGLTFNPYVKGCKMGNIIVASGSQVQGDNLLTMRFDTETNFVEATTVSGEKVGDHTQMTSHWTTWLDNCVATYHSVPGPTEKTSNSFGILR